MTAVQETEVPAATAAEKESVVYIVVGASQQEMNRLNSIVKSTPAVDSRRSSWKGTVVDGEHMYLVVFKSNSHAGQHKVRLRERISEEIPSLTITST